MENGVLAHDVTFRSAMPISMISIPFTRNIGTIYRSNQGKDLQQRYMCVHVFRPIVNKTEHTWQLLSDRARGFNLVIELKRAEQRKLNI